MDFTVAQVQRGLQRYFRSAETGFSKPQVSDVSLLASGFEADAYAFTLKAGGAPEAHDFVLRLYAGEGAAEKAGREFAAMGRLRDAGYPVPRVLPLDQERSTFGRPFMVMERIRGSSLAASYELASPDRQQELQYLHCRLMVQLHALHPADILPNLPPDGTSHPSGFIERELSWLDELLGQLEGGEPLSLRRVLDWLAAHGSQIHCERLSVIHGDFHANNVLLRADGAPFVIDWSNARLADYRTDLAWNRLLMRSDPRFLRDETGWNGDWPTMLRTYERLAGREAPMIDTFEVIAGTRLLLSVLNSLQFGAARRGMRPGAEALMRRDTQFMTSVAALLQQRTGIRMSDLEDLRSALAGKSDADAC
jgi:aminoglycoside phosphotransferase (APT) family kinase protein